MSGGAFAHTTPFPNYLLDAVMPALSDTQWRVLCVVVRQTLGWQDKASQQDKAGQAARKTTDWLTHAQLKQRTQRGNSAVSKAVDTLVRKGVIVVTDEAGRVLATPRERQACRSRLGYRLVSPDRLASSSFPVRPQGVRPQRVLPQSAIAFPQSGMSFPHSGLHKAETTKQKPDKRKEKEIHKEKEKGNEAASDEAWADPAVRQILSEYLALCKRHRGQRPSRLSWREDASLVRELLDQYPGEQLTKSLHQFFARRDFHSMGYALRDFQFFLNR
jgi:hypothetical protein